MGNVVALSPPLLSVRLSVTSRRSFAMLPSTLNRRCPQPLPPPPWRSLMNFPTARSSPLEMNVSVAQRLSSSLHSLEWKPVASTRPPTTPSWSAMLTSVRISMPTPSCPEVPPCTPVLLTVCRRKSPLLPHPPSRSRSLLPQRESTLSGSEDPSLLLSPPSSRCGSPSRSTMSAAHPLSTASASKQFCFYKSTVVPIQTVLKIYNHIVRRSMQVALAKVSNFIHSSTKMLNNSFGNMLK